LSSILKALKKLEQESPDQESTQSLPKKIDTKKAINRRVQANWRLNKLYSIVLIAIVLLTAGWLTLTHNPFLTQKPTSVPKSDKKNNENKVLEAMPPERNVPKESKIATAKNKAPSPGPVRYVNNEVPRNPTPHGKKTPLDIPRRLEAPEAPLSRAPAPMAAKPLTPLELKKDTRFELQAIAWSNSAESRIAVINGQILREGGSIEGVRVTRIDMDEVIVQEGSNKWKLRCKSRH
jgi:hypothetical protein